MTSRAEYLHRSKETSAFIKQGIQQTAAAQTNIFYSTRDSWNNILFFEAYERVTASALNTCILWQKMKQARKSWFTVHFPSPLLYVVHLYMYSCTYSLHGLTCIQCKYCKTVKAQTHEHGISWSIQLSLYSECKVYRKIPNKAGLVESTKKLIAAGEKCIIPQVRF